ncbi:class I SAM-dependent methyltransferase [Shewanella sp. D64]|uniref:class I SAM-dependent methyltransferase n=1 Tax=unclassified Shewanella TaxID=196818 RepID=UPI0022BA6AB4|nr:MULTISPECIES: class I SAM-dependent methyltransferase [unclassified Shewanella]MEC4727096.1 class I SAM-dependent methyltransferase [Shewanella sp. D64]MEC4737835.1 class I SAM-dependent methyltransferase [Shewanella sp. E94]WBJ93909.1 class I SAM-dependent methyltransferase [Shewanella sp. MTB7]
MDQTTSKVKEMYEQYPYPSGEPTIRPGFDIRLLLSYVAVKRNSDRPLQVLDAGCGRGPGVIGAASLQPNVNFTAIDINSVGLAEARANAKARGLTNINFVQADLMTLEGLDVPEGGFDVIYSSGVLHHLADPQVGLNNLTHILAPHGVISLMLYGSFGRQALYRLIEGINIISPKDASIESRIPMGRLLSKAAEETIFKDNYWKNTYRNPDVEFVDTCLNVNEVSYDIAGLWQLITQANMKFVRWVEPDVWSVDKRFSDPDLLARLKELSAFEQYQVIERLFEAPKLDFIICGAGNDARERITVAEIEASTFVVNPETSFFIEKRNQDQAQRIESVGYKVRHREKQNVSNPILAQLILLLAEQTTCFKGTELIDVLAQSGVEREMANEVIFDLLDEEIIFIP